MIQSWRLLQDAYSPRQVDGKVQVLVHWFTALSNRGEEKLLSSSTFSLESTSSVLVKHSNVCREQRKTAQCSGTVWIQWWPATQCVLVGKFFGKLQGQRFPTFPGGCTTLGQDFSYLQPEFPAPQFLVITLVLMSITTILSVNSLQTPVSTQRAGLHRIRRA